MAVTECYRGSEKFVLPGRCIGHLWSEIWSTGRALFRALFKKLLRRAETFCYTRNSKKSMIRLCTFFLPKMFQATSAGTVIGTWKASLKSVMLVSCTSGYALFWQFFASKIIAALPRSLHILRSTHCHSHNKNTTTRLPNLMWYSLSPISDLFSWYQTCFQVYTTYIGTPSNVQWVFVSWYTSYNHTRAYI